jgi:hypothetical protein
MTANGRVSLLAGSGTGWLFGPPLRRGGGPIFSVKASPCGSGAGWAAAESDRQTVSDWYPAKLVAAAVAPAVTTTKAAVTTTVTFIAAVATASWSREERATEDRR